MASTFSTHSSFKTKIKAILCLTKVTLSLSAESLKQGFLSNGLTWIITGFSTLPEVSEGLKLSKCIDVSLKVD